MVNAFKVDRLVMIPALLPKRTSMDQFDTMQEALDSTMGKRIFFEPTGSSHHNSIKYYNDIVLIFGNANTHNLKHVRSEDITVRINTPSNSVLFSTQAAAIALAARCLT
jgi:tRNA(Leu) C34 or U34 (ribose-2'-O)-methylase TrmL